MNRFVLFLIPMFLTACWEDTNRVVVEAVSPEGQAFHFMPISENGVTDVSVLVAWQTNWAHRAGTNPAVPHVGAETILSGGTSEMQPQDILEFFAERNASGAIHPSVDHIIGELSFPREHTQQVIALANEMLVAPQFDEKWVQRGKSNFRAHQIQSLDAAASRGWMAVRQSIFKDQPITRHLNISDLDATNAVTPDDLRVWHSEAFTKTDLKIVVTGAISEKDAGVAIDQLLAGLPDGPAQQIMNPTADFTPKTILLHVPDAEKTSIGFVGHLPPTSEGDDGIDLLALSYFGQAGSGPLFQAIRTELRASYKIQAGVANYTRDQRILFISGEVETEKLTQVRDAVLETYANFRTEPDLSAFEELRQNFENGTRENIKYVSVVANTMLQLALDGLDPATGPQLAEIFANMTEDDVKTRLDTVFPQASDLMVIAVSADPKALSDACVITRFEDAVFCP